MGGPVSSDETPTPVPDTSRQTGARSVAEGARRDCLRLAEQLDTRARLLAQESGRPDLAMHRIASVLRDLARRYLAWPTVRTAPGDRQQDRDDTLRWYAEGQAALEAHPAPTKSEPP